MFQLLVCSIDQLVKNKQFKMEKVEEQLMFRKWWQFRDLNKEDARQKCVKKLEQNLENGGERDRYFLELRKPRGRQPKTC